MKYIRTKDGIYKATEINGMIIARGGVAFSSEIADVHHPIVFNKKDIINQANTIEELCDEFVRIVGSGRIDLVSLKIAKMYKISYPNIKLYGAIWTDKGLIYVAKMNEKGELELL